MVMGSIISARRHTQVSSLPEVLEAYRCEPLVYSTPNADFDPGANDEDHYAQFACCLIFHSHDFANMYVQ